MIELLTAPTPNGWKVSIMLEECGLAYRVREVNIGKGEQFAPDFLAVSPNNRIPAIIDHAPADGGAPISVFETGAILLYLAEKTGQFLAASGPERIAAWEWLMWQMGGFGPMPGQVHHFLQVSDPTDQKYGLARYQKETERLYGVLDRRLAISEYVATAGEPSVADFAILGWAWRHERHRVDLARFPQVKRWYEAMMARPATARGFEVALS